jgi:predicted TIM-barrel fold metal-dependent hydrolase
MWISRRQVLRGLAASPAAIALTAETEWPSPVLDIHLHPRRDGNSELNHLKGSGVTKAVLLTGLAAEERAKDLVTKYPDRFVRFTGGAVSAPDAVERFRASLKGGAIGLGEMKNPVQVDGPEMRRIYDLAAERHVPVLIHLEEGNFNSGIHRLPDLLKTYQNTVFIGHGQSWWANISAEVQNEAGYPQGRIKKGGLIDMLLADYPNIYGDLSANSGRNALTRDPDFVATFLARHKAKLLFGSDCMCRDGRGAEQQQAILAGKCIARETLTALQQLASPDLFRTIAWDNGTKLLKISA